MDGRLSLLVPYSSKKMKNTGVLVKGIVWLCVCFEEDQALCVGMQAAVLGNGPQATLVHLWRHELNANLEPKV